MWIKTASGDVCASACFSFYLHKKRRNLHGFTAFGSFIRYFSSHSLILFSRNFRLLFVLFIVFGVYDKVECQRYSPQTGRRRGGSEKISKEFWCRDWFCVEPFYDVVLNNFQILKLPLHTFSPTSIFPSQVCKRFYWNDEPYPLVFNVVACNLIFRPKWLD